MKQTSRKSRLGIYALLPFVGLLAVSIPVLVNPEPWYDSPLLPFVRTTVERMGGGALILLFFTAAAVGATIRGISIALASFAFLALLPLTTVAEISVDPRSHSLWPFELAIYLMLAVVPAVGLWVGRLAATPSQPWSPPNSNSDR